MLSVALFLNHDYERAIDINPLENPFYIIRQDGSLEILLSECGALSAQQGSIHPSCDYGGG